ncbi:hypothetical protein [Actinoplanes rectilineatus]|uniref:hypothetical protein n=1 Tax=Actinoplanes rectilineatus TaxID=113571 RepID=UPI0005F2786D|nr:hypothetical protein [Actinoplanes rectilineatus]
MADTASAEDKSVGGKRDIRQARAAAFAGSWVCSKGQTIVEIESTTRKAEFVRYRVYAGRKVAAETLEVPKRGAATYSVCLPAKPSTIRVEVIAYTIDEERLDSRRLEAQNSPLYPG